MARKLLTARGAAIYARRKAVVEPVFGQVKQARGIRQLMMRGIEKARSEYRELALDELETIQAELESVREQALKARDVRQRSEIVAPVAGTVVRLHYHTQAGIIESGKPILEILPAEAPLIVEVQIPRTDIDSVERGQHAAVRLTAHPTGDVSGESGAVDGARTRDPRRDRPVL